MSKTTDWVIDDMNRRLDGFGIAMENAVFKTIASSHFLNMLFGPVPFHKEETMADKPKEGAFYNMKEPVARSMTACGKCKHLLKMPGVWKEFNEGLFCRAMPKQGEFNCFTGGYAPTTFCRCNEVNQGNCANYVEEVADVQD